MRTGLNVWLSAEECTPNLNLSHLPQQNQNKGGILRQDNHPIPALLRVQHQHHRQGRAIVRGRIAQHHLRLLLGSAEPVRNHGHQQHLRSDLHS